MTQGYECYVNQAHVIRGNDVLLKCDIPSFVADLVSVTSWIDNEDNEYTGREQGKASMKELSRRRRLASHRLLA